MCSSDLTSEGVHEQKFEPSGYGNDARNDTVEHGCHEHERANKSK